MEKVYIISRYSARSRKELIINKKVARYFCREIMKEGKRPVAPHLFYPQFCNDNDPEERLKGTSLAIKDLDECDSFLLVIVDGVISEGMKRELEYLSCRKMMHGRIAVITKEQAGMIAAGR